MPLRLPPEDRVLSPLTGWTRAHWEAVADHLLAGVEPWATDGFAQYRLPGPPSRNGVTSDGLEGFARTFLLAAFRKTHLDRYAAGLIAGTDPAHPFAWPAITDMSQQIVEAASITIALHETRAEIFDRLRPAEQERVVTWLSGIVGRRTPDSNWILFTVIVEQFLGTVGSPVARIDGWYAGGGWYSDGPGQNFDYYNAFALHLYPLLWARMAGREHHGHLDEFLDGYQHFFAADGSPVFQGRSLTYRFATVAPLWFGRALPPGRIRRIASGVLKRFVTEEPGDLLTLGWFRPFAPMIQPYSGPASPYWASKAFVGLLFAADHPVWTAVEEPAEIELHDVTRTLDGPGWLLHGTRADGVIRLLNHGSDRAAKSPGPDPLYVRLAYSTHTSPQFGAEAVDGQIAVIGPDGRASRRRHVERAGAGASAYSDGPVRVLTTVTIEDHAEVRVHEVTAPAGHLVRDGGHALAGDLPPGHVVTGDSATVTRPDGMTSSITAREGFTSAGVRDSRGTDPFGEHSATPYLEGVHPGGTCRFVSVVGLGRAPERTGEPGV